MDRQIIISIVVVAVMALIARIIINKKQFTKINWSKIVLIFSSVAIYFAVFLNVDVYELSLAFKSDATFEESRAEDISGRFAAKDSKIAELSSVNDIDGNFYCVAKPVALEPTNYYIIKKRQQISENDERSVETSIDDREIISHKRNLFDVTRTPGDNIDSYVPLYKATFADSTAILMAVLPKYAISENLPVGKILPVDGKLANVANDNNAAKYYINTFNQQLYDSNFFNQTMWRSSVALVVVIVFLIIYYSVQFLIRKQSK